MMQSEQEQIITQKIVNEIPDSLTLGTPKDGSIKVYGSSDRPEEFKQKIDNMLEIRKYAKEQELK